MSYWLIGLALPAAVVGFLWRANFFVSIDYKKAPGVHLFGISVLLFKKFKIYTLELSPEEFLVYDPLSLNLQAAKKSGKVYEKVQILPPDKEHLDKYYELIKKFIGVSRFEKLSFKMIYGFEDAAATGISFGLLSIFKEIFLLLFYRYFEGSPTPEFIFQPVYGQDRLEAEFKCIFTVRLGNVIGMALVNIQGGAQKWLNIPFKTS